jgi:protein-tyrosine phosphatase
VLHATIGAVAARRPIPDASNLRDLGGHRTTTGATVKWRTLYRSNELSRLSDESVRALAAIGIRTICDFRNEKERAAAPTRLPPGDALQTHLMPIGVKSQLGSVLSTSGVTESDVRQALQAIYRSFALDYAPAYQALFDRLIESHHYPLVFHCSAGKDRTGVAAALILTALGVPKDAVFEDYLLTNDYWSAPAHILPGSSGEARKAALAAHPEYLMAAFDAIDQSYGSIDRYLVEAMGLTPQRRAQLEANLLEQSV